MSVGSHLACSSHPRWLRAAQIRPVWYHRWYHDAFPEVCPQPVGAFLLCSESGSMLGEDAFREALYEAMEAG